MTIDPADWQRREALLDQLLDLPLDDREGFLATLAHASAADAKALRDWLDGIEQSTGYLTPPIGGDAISHDGEVVGPWRVRRLLGRGGMGEVWLGERADGLYSREVAIKFIRDDRPALRRSIESERRVLAGLRHPGIVRLVDAGSTIEGHPYLVTDHIDGITVDEWLARIKPDLGARLDLFRQVADAVAHAHEQLVVHRDIKPTNVLVDDNGRSHLLDFGIARALAHTDDSAQATEAALTPEFAAPELVVSNRASVRTDVYALGGLLYYLLSGRPPLPLRELALAEVVARIRDEMPARLILDERTPSLRTTPERWLADLDAIARKALAKDPVERYGSVEAMLQDVHAVSANRPVSARAPDMLDRARRYLRRHRAAFAAIGVITLSLLAGIVGTLWQAQAARAERDRAEAAAAQALKEAETANAVRDFLVDVFESANPEHTLGQVPTVLDLVEAGVRRAEGGLHNEPQLQAELMGTLGETYIGLGRYDLAEEVLRKAFERAEVTLGSEAAATERLVVRLARAVNAKGGPYDEVQARLDRLLATSTPTTPDALAIDAMARAEYGSILHKTGRLDEADAALSRAVGEAREAGDAGYEALVAALHQQVVLADERGSRGEAIARLREIVVLTEAHPGGSATQTNVALLGLATLLGEEGHGDEAASMLQRVVDSNIAIYGREHPATIRSMVALARARMRLSDFGTARSLLEDALATGLQRYGESSEAVALARINLAALEYALGDAGAAIVLIEKVQAEVVRSDGPNSPRALMMRQNLARMHLEQGDLQQAETELQELLEGLKAIGSNDHAEALALLGDIASQRGDPGKARDLHRQALAVYAENGDEASFDVQDHRLALALDERDLGDLAAARRYAETGLAGLQRLDAQANAAMIDYARFVLAQLDVLARQCSTESRTAFEAIRAREQQKNRHETSTASAWKLARVEFYLGLCLRQLDGTDAQAARMIATSADTLLAAPRVDPYTRRLAAAERSERPKALGVRPR